MDNLKCASTNNTPSVKLVPESMCSQIYTNFQARDEEESSDSGGSADADINLREVYFLVMHFLSAGPCQRTIQQLWDELLEHDLLPRRYHAWFSRNGGRSGEETDDGISFPLHYSNLVERYSHIQKDHLIKLLKQLVLAVAPPFRSVSARIAPGAADVPTLLGTGSFSLLSCHRDNRKKQVKHPPSYLRWPHMQADQLHALSLREIGGGFSKHHRAPSIRLACYAIAKPSTMVQKMQLNKKLRGHRDAVYCAIFDRSGRYIITGSDDRLVKIWSMETAFCLASCRGHVGDITDLAVSSNNAVVASASNDFSIRVWRLADGHPISVLNGHTGAVTAIAFNPRPNSVYQLLSSSDDGTCRIWDARFSQCSPRVYLPKPTESVAVPGKSVGSSSSNVPQSNRILCCAYNANGTVFVTGSSDTYARVWSAQKSSVDDPEKPSHEIDILAGHENDVNYVQFSGSTVTTRSLTSDSIMEDNIPKFKNSWHRHDNIVTCSRDGSAIIWIPRSRRSTVKGGRWTRAYHLKVPPPPMPPQPPRGGPRQRFLPTPRGVNMIVWSLDNRFVLAAIMDCRICVWNASDGSLVHSLTGHSASTYVLDVHPFNPRIAMSAGYDGKTIIWDIWEGTPIRIYEAGPYKLVDGKFSPDGTSIVLSDDVGQIYLLNTGQGESQKDAKYDQFFLGDYRPLIQDTHGNVVDQETQLAPYRRNTLDFLCDSSMFPYPEPYQSMYQRRRLGALGLEWRPSTIKFAIGTDIPLADLDVVMEPLPDLTDVIFWEPENDLMDDDTDSEYNATTEYYSEGHPSSLSESSSKDSVYSGEESGGKKRQSLRSSKRKKRVSDVEVMASPKRHVKKRIMNYQDASSSRNRRTKKIGNCRRTSSKKKIITARSSRPNRMAKANANSGYFLHSEDSEDSIDEEDEDTSESDSSFVSESEERELVTTVVKRREPQRGEIKSSHDDAESGEANKLAEPCHVQNEKKKPLVLKFSFRNTKGSLTSDTPKPHSDKTGVACLSPSSSEQSSRDNRIASDTFQPGCSLAKADELAQNCTTNDLGTIEEPVVYPNDNLPSLHENTVSSWGEVKSRSSKRIQSGDVSIRDTVSSESHHWDDIGYNDPVTAINYVPDVTEDLGNEFFSREDVDVTRNHDYTQTIHGSGASGNQSISLEDGTLRDPHHREGKEMITSIDQQTSEKPKSWRPKIRIKSRSILAESKGDAMGINSSSNHSSEYDSCMEQKSRVSVVERNYNSAKHSSIRSSTMNRNVHSETMLSQSHVARVNTQGSQSRGGELGEHMSKGNILKEERETGFPHAATDASRRLRSLKSKAASRQTNVNSCKLKINQGQTLLDSQNAERASSRVLDSFPSTRGASTSNSIVRSRSLRTMGYEATAPPNGTNHINTQKKPNWLLLTEKEEKNSYIPQLNDEVMYVRQGHHEYLNDNNLPLRGPWMKYWANARVVELCLVEDLKYTTHGGSGESCCEITLRFIDSSSKVQGQKFRLTLPEIRDCPDFLVERTWYDASMERNWSPGDRCQVWWDNAGGRDGTWWEGYIQDVKVQSSEFPGSPWKIFYVRYNNDEEEFSHCPWELHDPSHLLEHLHIDPGSRKKMMSSIRKLQRSAPNKEDHHGILKLEQVAQKSEFINRFPVPLSLDTIQLRLANNYYRRMEALKNDIKVMLTNAQSYFDGNRTLLKKINNLSRCFDDMFLELERAT